MTDTTEVPTVMLRHWLRVVEQAATARVAGTPIGELQQAAERRRSTPPQHGLLKREENTPAVVQRINDANLLADAYLADHSTGPDPLLPQLYATQDEMNDALNRK